MKSPLIRCVGMIAWLITAVVSLHVGMQAIGYDVFMRMGLENNPMANLWVQYIVGIAGLVSLILLVMALTCRGCCGDKRGYCGDKGCNDSGYCSKCGCSPCKCGPRA